LRGRRPFYPGRWSKITPPIAKAGRCSVPLPAYSTSERLDESPKSPGAAPSLQVYGATTRLASALDWRRGSRPLSSSYVPAYLHDAASQLSADRKTDHETHKYPHRGPRALRGRIALHLSRERACFFADIRCRPNRVPLISPEQRRGPLCKKSPGLRLARGTATPSPCQGGLGGLLIPAPGNTKGHADPHMDVWGRRGESLSR
jgi:hypothetical protein